MSDLKKISRDAIPRAVQKAERYRLLNQSWATESICLDILEVEPGNQQAQVMLVLALSDQAGERGSAAARAQQLASQLQNEYERLYYSGLVAERRARAHLQRGGVALNGVYDWLVDALDCFARAEAIRPAGNDDAILRWNTCARTLERLRLVEQAEGQYEPTFGE